MGLRPLDIFYSFSDGDRLWTSESDVFKRYILTSKDGPRAESVNHMLDFRRYKRIKNEANKGQGHTWPL